MKQILLIILLALQAISLSAQEKTDTTFVFRFPAQSDMFYTPWNGNGAMMDSLLSVVSRNRAAIETGKVYLSVSSYTAADSKMGFTRNLRVKSALIVHAGLREANFVTDRVFAMSDSLGRRNIVVVALPASVDKVVAIAGEQAATRVREYQQELIYNSPEAIRARDEAAQREVARKQAEAEAQEASQRVVATVTEVAPTQDVAPQATPAIEPKPLEKPYTLSIRANLLSWATLTPNLGVEWRINRHLGVMVNGSWTSWSWDDANRRYAMWKLSPEVRYYMGREKRGYLGAMYHIGEFNYKFDETGRQGDYQGGAITGGYQLPLNRSLSLDFHAGVGYTRADYDKYKIIEGTKVRQGSDTKNYWGINQLGVTLVWKIIK